MAMVSFMAGACISTAEVGVFIQSAVDYVSPLNNSATGRGSKPKRSFAIMAMKPVQDLNAGS